MLTKSANYNTIFSNPSHYAEVKIIVGEVGGTRTTYGMDKLMSLSTHSSLYGDYIDIGNSNISSFDATLHGVLPTAIPKMSRVEVWCRLTAGTNYTNWLPKGIFYTKKPTYDSASGNLMISGYDVFYRAESLPYPIGSTVSGWNLETLRSVAQRMATFIDIALEDATQVGTDSFALPPFGYTAREILNDIATASGGNWMLTYVNSGTELTPVMTPKLRLVPIDSTNTATALGQNVQSFNEGDPIDTVGYVIVNYGFDNDGATLSKFSGTEGSGRTVEYTISTITDGDVIQDFADDILARYSNLSYDPFTATGCELDPACELGDSVSCNGATAVFGGIDTAFSKAMYADITAPGTPEEEDFPMYSSDREIQRNYETEASKIAGAVKFVNLSTPGETVINGSNIKGGTITLGGVDNGDGEIMVYDEDGNLIGSWTKDGLVIKDDVAIDTSYSSLYAHFKIQKIGSNDNDQFGILGGLQRGSLTPDEITPFFRLKGTFDGTNVDSNTVVSSSRVEVTTYPDPALGLTGYNQTLITGGFVTISDTRQSGGTPVSGAGYTQITPMPTTPTVTPSKSSGTATISSITVNKWGRLVQMTIYFSNPTAAGDGEQMWNGSIGNATGLLPVAMATGSSQYGHNTVGGRLYDDNGTLKLVMWAGSGGYWANWDGYISFTYMV